MDTKDGTAEDREEKSSEEWKTGTIIREAMEKLLEFEEKVDKGRKDILNTILNGLSGLEVTYDERLTGLEEDIKKLKGGNGKQKGAAFDFISLKEEHLFSIDIDAQLENDLNNKIFSEKLKDEFKTEKGITPSESAYLQKEEENKWKITDKEKVYIIKKEDETLNIYKVELNISEVVNALRQILKEPEKLNISEVINPLRSIVGAVKGVYLFSWDSVPESDNEKLIRFLRDDLDIEWVENAKISKSDDGMTINISKGENSAAIIVNENKEKAILKVNDKTYDLKVKTENGKLNIYSDFIPPKEKFESIIRKFEKLREAGLGIISEKDIDKVKAVVETAVLLPKDEVEIPEELREEDEGEDEIIKRIYHLSTLDQRIEETDGRIGESDGRIEKIDERIEETDERIEETDGRIEKIDERMEETDGHMEEMKKRLEIESLYRKGIALLRKNVFNDARNCFDKITTMNPNLKGAWLNKGFALAKQRRFREEIDCYDKALKIDGNYDKAIHNRKIALKKVK